MISKYKILMISIAVVAIIGVPTVSYGQAPPAPDLGGPPPLEQGESGGYIGGDFQEEVEEIISIIVDGVKSFFKWLCFWCDD